MADPILQFMDRRGAVYPTPEAAITSDIAMLTGFGPAISLGIVQRRELIAELFGELDRLLATHGATIEAQEIERRTRKRPAIENPGPAEAPATTQEND